MRCLLCSVTMVAVAHLVGCTDLYVDRYTPATYGNHYAPVNESQLIEVKNVPAQTVKDTDFPNATVIGSSTFTVSSGDQGNPIQLAESIGADIVIVSRLYDTTKREKSYQRLPDTYTYYNRDGDLETRTYMQAIPVMRNVNYYRYEALFLRTTP